MIQHVLAAITLLLPHLHLSIVIADPADPIIDDVFLVFLYMTVFFQELS